MQNNNELMSLSLHVDSANEMPEPGTSEEELEMVREETAMIPIGFWTCPKCKKANHPNMRNCRRCKTPKPRPQPIPEENIISEAEIEGATKPAEAWKDLFKTNWYVTWNFNSFAKDAIDEEQITNQVVTFLNDYDGSKKIKAYAVGFEHGEEEGRFHAHAVISFKRSERPTAIANITVGAINQYTVHGNLSFLPKPKNIYKAVRYTCKANTKKYHEEGKDYFIYDDSGKFQAYARGVFNEKKNEKQTMKDYFIENLDDIQAGNLKDLDPWFVASQLNKLINYKEWLDNQDDKDIQLDHCRLIIIYGQPGTGKSSIAKDFAHELHLRCYVKSADKWWHNYKGEEVIIADEIRTDLTQELEAQFKIWGDRSPFQIDIKNRNKVICPKWFIITTNYTPHQLFNAGYDQPLSNYYLAMWRRAGYGHRLNEMDTIGQYYPKAAWSKLPEEQQRPFADYLRNFVEKNSVAWPNPQNDKLTA